MYARVRAFGLRTLVVAIPMGCESNADKLR
jgi:hypothetical protein